jgi:hypothetical protein
MVASVPAQLATGKHFWSKKQVDEGNFTLQMKMQDSLSKVAA